MTSMKSELHFVIFKVGFHRGSTLPGRGVVRAARPPR